MVALGLVAVQLTTTSMVVGFTNPQSLLRPAALPPMMLYAFSQLSCVQQIQHPAGRAFLGAASVFLVILYIDLALLSRWTFNADGPTSSIGGLTPVDISQSATESNSSERKSSQGVTQTVLARLRFGFRISLQSRFPGTKWPVKNIPPFSRHGPSHVPTKVDFLVRNALKCSIYILILRLSNRFGSPDQNPVLFSQNQIPFFTRLRDVSASEVGTRFLSVMGYWTVQYMVIQVLYSILAILAVTLRITDVKVWPPVFGSVGDAWSIRQFWG